MEYSDSWKSDYLWIPSRGEIGKRDVYYLGLWKTRYIQNKDYDKDKAILTTENQVSWTRSSSASASYPGRMVWTVEELSESAVTTFRSVRPAIHLNLTAIEDSFRNTSAGSVNNSDGTINKSTLSNVYKYLSGSSSATISTISSLATSGMTAEDIREASFSAGDGSIPDKLEGEDLTITFGGLRWDIVYLGKDKSGNSILTLWLSDFNFDAFNHRSSTEGEHYGYLNGALYSDWSCDWNSTTVGDSPSNMYGSSYIRVVTLNNGGTYSTGASSSATATQNADSVFAPFTMSGIEGSLTQYLVKPSNVSWQESGQTTQSKFMYNCSNENWSTSTSNDGYYQIGAYNYASK